MTCQISVVAPCLNEENNVEILFDRLSKSCVARGLSFELVLIDDGSTDDTWKKCVELKTCFPLNVVTARHESNLGIPVAWQTGVSNAKGEFVCLIDSDLQNPPEFVVELFDALLTNDCDFVQGFRIPTTLKNPPRLIMSRSLNWVLNWIFGMQSRDNKSGFIIGSRENMANIIRHSGSYRHFQTFINVSAHCRGYSVVEIPTPFDRRHSGTSFLDGKSVATILGVLSDIKVARNEFKPRQQRFNG